MQITDHTNTTKNTDTSCANLMAQRIQSCCSTRVSSRSALQVQRIYCRKKAHKSCSIFTVKENKMSTRPPNKTSCLPAHSNREMYQKNPPILVLSRTGVHVYTLQANGLAPVGNRLESLRCLSSCPQVSKISLHKVIEDFCRWQVTSLHRLAEPSGLITAEIHGSQGGRDTSSPTL